LNAAAAGRRLGISAAAVRYRVALLEKARLIRVLPSLAHRREHLVLRDGRLLQELGGSPGAILRTCLTECIIVGLAATGPPVRCFRWEAGRVKRIDLVTFNSKEKLGFRFSERLVPLDRDVACLRNGLHRGIIDRGFLIHCGVQACLTARVVIVLPVREFVGNLQAWLACGSFREARELLRKVLHIL
jgi:hypothetical protein